MDKISKILYKQSATVEDVTLILGENKNNSGLDFSHIGQFLKNNTFHCLFAALLNCQDICTWITCSSVLDVMS